MKNYNFKDLENLNLYYVIENLKICFIDDLQFTITTKDIENYFPNNIIYDLSKSYKIYLEQDNFKYFTNFKMIVFFNEFKESIKELKLILKYFTGILIVKKQIDFTNLTFVDTFGEYYVYEIE
jgi:hypothetical protein